MRVEIEVSLFSIFPPFRGLKCLLGPFALALGAPSGEKVTQAIPSVARPQLINITHVLQAPKENGSFILYNELEISQRKKRKEKKI